MKVLIVPGAAVFLMAAGLLVSTTPAACACGEVYEGKAAFHWDEMTFLERMRFKTTGYVPFDRSGDRL